MKDYKWSRRWFYGWLSTLAANLFGNMFASEEVRRSCGEKWEMGLPGTVFQLGQN